MLFVFYLCLFVFNMPCCNGQNDLNNTKTTQPLLTTLFSLQTTLIQDGYTEAIGDQIIETKIALLARKNRALSHLEAGLVALQHEQYKLSYTHLNKVAHSGEIHSLCDATMVIPLDELIDFADNASKKPLCPTCGGTLNANCAKCQVSLNGKKKCLVCFNKMPTRDHCVVCTSTGYVACLHCNQKGVLPCKKCKQGVNTKYSTLKGLGKNTLSSIQKMLTITNILRQKGIDYYSPNAFDTIKIKHIKFMAFAVATSSQDDSLDRNNIH